MLRLKKIMRSAFVTVLFLAFASVGVAQTSVPGAASNPPLPKDAAEIFATAAAMYDFTSPTLKPWHMKVSYQLYDNQDKPTVQGSYEYWWASPDIYRSTWLRPGVEHTDWHVAGQHYHAETGESLEFFERKLQSDLLTPLPKPEDLDPEKVRFDRREENFGSVKLPCIMVIRKMPLNGRVQLVPMGMFPTFCFDLGHPTLRAYYAFGATSVIYNKFVFMQGLYLPRELGIFDGKRRVLTATVDVVEGLLPTAKELTPSKDATQETGPHHVPIGSAVAQGFLIKSVQPVYPQDAKDNRIQGRVELQATIGTDGRIHELSVMDGPSPSLIASAMSSVLQWHYRPYLLNGAPVEVETTINVIYKLGD
jgi:TonB family protein